MAAVNWFCLVLAFAFINNIVCIKVDPNGIPPNGNYTTISLNSQTIMPYTKSTIYASAGGNEPRNNLTLLGDTELSASERTRRLIPYMAFYVPVSELPINKQYASKNNIHTAQKQQLAIRPTGSTGGSHIPIPPQYVHSTLEYLPSAPSLHAGPSASSSPNGQQQYYQPNAGVGVYHSYAAGPQQHPQQQFHLQQQSIHLQPPGPPGPSATGFPPSLAVGPGHINGNGNNNHNAYLPYKEVNPIRHKTVQHFPPLSSTASTAVSSPSSAMAYENVRQTSSGRKQQKQSHRGTGSGNAASIYRPRTKQSKINLTPFTPSNSVPGNFVPIVYTPVNSNNNNNNNILNSPAVSGSGVGIIDSTSYSQEENQQYHKQQLLNPPHHQPQQIAIEYSSGPLPPSVSAASIPIDAQPVTPQRPHHPHHHLQHQQRNHLNPKQQSQQQYYSVTTSPVNVDLTHDVVSGLGGGSIAGDSLNAAHHSQHHHHHQHSHPPLSVHNSDAISPPPTIYHQNQQQQLQPEHVIIDATLRTSQQHQQQILTGISSEQQQQQQLYNNGGKTALQFQPPKPESFFDSELHLQHQQQQHQQQNIEQVVLKDVNSNVSQMMTPQEKYVMYLQQRIRYNKHQHQQRQQATRQKYRERNNNSSNDKQHHQNPTQIFVLSSTMSPPPQLPPTYVSPDTITALAPIHPSAQPSYNSNYPQHSPIHHDLYPRPIIKPLTNEAGIRTTATGTRVGGETGTGTAGGVAIEEQVLTIPVHSLFGELDTLQHPQQQHPHNHYSQSHSASPSSSHHQHHSHKSQYSKNGPGKPQYIDYLIDEPKQSLDDEQHYQRQKPPQQQLELLKPTLGPPSHAYILVTTAAPFLHEPVTQENYGSSLRPPYKNKPKIRLQPVLKENNVNYATIREQNPTGRPQVVAITPTVNKAQVYHEENDMSPKYVYVKEEFGQKIASAPGVGGGAVKLKPSNKYKSDDNQIPQRQQQQHHHPHNNQQQQQPEDNIALQPLAPSRQPETTHHSHHQQQEAVDNNESAMEMTPPKTILADPNELPDIRTSSLAEILHKLQESNHLPHTLTPDNIDNSIKTLIRILNNLKQTQTIVANPPQHHETPAHPPPSSPDYDYTTGSEEDQQKPEAHDDDISLLTPTTGPNKHPGPSTGRPGIDYPNYAVIPETSFDCSEQRYKGFFGDPETNCQVWHYCDLNGGKASFLCPNGTIFSQIALTCDWWFNVKCATTPQLYVLNERLYKYILPFTPKFPEDYSGPIVDKYLAMKFQEMEEKMRLEKEKALQEEAEVTSKESEENNEPIAEDSQEDNHLEETTTTEDNSNKHAKAPPPPAPNKHESINSLVSEQSSERNLLIDDEVDNISERGGALEKFESTTIASIPATAKPDITSFSLKPIIVSSTMGPDYDEEQLQRHDNDKRCDENTDENKTDKDGKQITADKKNTEEIAETGESMALASSTDASANRMHITVEKVDVIEIKPDGATGHLIRDMLMNSKQTK